MPKLQSKLAKRVAKAEVQSGDFPVWAPGKYIAELAVVEARVGKESGKDYWSVEFSNVVALDGEEQTGRIWMNVSLPALDVTDVPDSYVPSAAALKRAKGDRAAAYASGQSFVEGRLHAFFEAFGYTPDSDTDEMIGERCVIQVGIETQQRGAGAGKERNVVNNVFALDTVDAVAGDDEDDDDDF